MIRPLPRSLAPLPDESLLGLLLRLAHRLDTSPLRLAKATGLTSRAATRVPTRLLLEMTTQTTARFATATRMSISEAAALTLATLHTTYRPVDPDFAFHRRTGGDTGRSVNGVFVQERWLLARSQPAAAPGGRRRSPEL